MEKQKILVVDDNVKLLKLGKAIFESGGYDVVTAADGIEALSILSDQTIALIITDILMPNMDGYTLCYYIRQNDFIKNIPIIIYSATYTSQSDEALAGDVGADMFVRKPSTMIFLLNAVKELLSAPRKPPQEDTSPHELSAVTRQYNARLIEKLEQKNVKLEKSQGSLVKSEGRFRALIENNFDAITLKNENGKILYQSPAVERMMGYRMEDTNGANASNFFHPDDVPDLLKRVDMALKNPGKPIYGMNRMLHKDGHYIWVEGTTTNLLEDENVTAIVGNFRDITGRKLADEKVESVSRLYAFLSAINQTIVHADNAQTVFTEACRIAVEVGKFELAWISILDKTNGRLTVIAHCNVTAGDLEMLNNLTNDRDWPAEYTLQTGKPYVINDFDDEPENSSARKYAVQRGFKSAIALPILKSGKMTAIYNLFSSRVNSFDEAEIALLEEAARDISFALDIFEKELHRKQMEDKILHSELSLKQAQAIAHFGSFDIDYAAGSVVWSEECCRIYGLRPDDNNQSYQSWLSFIHPDDLEEVKKITSDRLETSHSIAFHHRIIRRDGTVRHIYSQSRLIFNAQGIPVGLNGVAHDITEAKEADAEQYQIPSARYSPNNRNHQFKNKQ